MEQRINACGKRVTGTFSKVLSALSGFPQRPVDLCRILGINKDLASKILLAIGKPDPFAAIYLMPGPEALRRLLRAAERRKIDHLLIQDAEQAVREFDDLIRNVAGSRAELNSAISSLLPEARQQFEMGNKQAMFKAVSNLKGLLAEMQVNSFLVAPPPDNNGKLDIGVLYGYIGLRRLRPSIPLVLSTGTTGREQEDGTHLAFDGTPVSPEQTNVMLTDFCSHPPPQLELRKVDSVYQYLLAGQDYGLNASVDIVCGEVLRGYLDQYQTTERVKKRAFSSQIETPVKSLVQDVFIHDSVWRGRDPELVLYDTGTYGSVDPNDPLRDLHKLDLQETCHYLGRGMHTVRISEVPRYAEMLDYACSSMGWDPEAFHCHRCRVKYPFYAGQLSLLFTPPMAPVDNG